MPIQVLSRIWHVLKFSQEGRVRGERMTRRWGGVKVREFRPGQRAPLGREKLIQCSWETTLTYWCVPRAPCHHCPSHWREPPGTLILSSCGMDTSIDSPILFIFIKWRNCSEILKLEHNRVNLSFQQIIAKFNQNS